MRVAIVGSGYSGCVTGVALAAHDHDVVLVDASPEVVGSIERARAPFHEPGLDDALAEVTSSGRLRATLDLDQAVPGAEIVFLCVGTPSADDGSIDLTQLVAAAEQVLAMPDDGEDRTLVVKSTVVPGTTVDVVGPLVDAAPGRWSLGVNPEFLREGQALDDGMNPDRIVYGAVDAAADRALQELYAPFDAPLVCVPPATAELIKYTSNALLATLVSFANQIADIAETLPGVSVTDVLNAVHADRRLQGPDSRPAAMTSYLVAGCGYGGSCLPKDLAALTHLAGSLGAPATMLEAVADVNATRAARMLDAADARLDGLAGRTVAVLGLSFKPDTDDVRASAALPIIEGLVARGASVRVFDPAALHHLPRLWPDERAVQACANVDDALSDADAAMLVTAWAELRRLPSTRFRSLMRTPVVIDGRGMLEDPTREGLVYWAVGDGPAA